MTKPELDLLVRKNLSDARADLLVYEELCLTLAQQPELSPHRGILICAKESMHATRLIVMEAAERLGASVDGKPAASGWGQR